MISDLLLVLLSMVAIRGSGSGVGVSGQDGPRLTKVRVREIIHEEVISIVREQIPELFGCIKTAMIEFFNDRYAALSENATAAATVAVVAVGFGVGRAF